jgi:hypothetical protein
MQLTNPSMTCGDGEYPVSSPTNVFESAVDWA